MAKTKEKILDAARRLFNESGYSQVTIRQIASALGMSSGNLNYHFRTREEILERLYFQMVERFDARVAALDQHSFSLKDIHRDMRDSMAQMVDYRFFWTDLYNLLTGNEKIRAHFSQARETREQGYRFLFQKLMEKGTLNPPSYPEEHDFLIQHLIDYSNTWLYASILYGKGLLQEDQIDRAAKLLLSMLYPHLSESGKAEYPGV